MRPKVRLRPLASLSFSRKLTAAAWQWLSLNKTGLSAATVSERPKLVSQLRQRTAACRDTLDRLESGG
jgi:hypothetical protein